MVDMLEELATPTAQESKVIDTRPTMVNIQEEPQPQVMNQ